MTAKESTNLLRRMAQTCSSGTKRKLSELADEHGLESRNMRSRLIAKATDETRSESPLAYQVSKRKPSIFTADVDAFMVEQSIKWDGEFTWQEMADAINEKYSLPAGVPSYAGVRKHCINARLWSNDSRAI